MKFFNLKNNRGFTLVESLVAISIFTSSILGMLSLVGGNISNTSYAKDRLVAVYLAQEGLEYMRNLRDTYVLYENNGFDAFKTHVQSCEDENGCYIKADAVLFDDFTQPMKDLEVIPCSTNCPNLLYDDSSYYTQFNYTTGIPSKFSRKIKINGVVNSETDYNREIEIVSTVKFTSGLKTYEASFSSYLKDWIE